MQMYLSKEIETQILEFRKKKEFTNLYVSCGFLGEKKPLLQYICGEKTDIYDLASLTKALVTAPLILDTSFWSTENLQQSIEEWLGVQLTKGMHTRLKKTKLLELLTHSSGLPAWSNFWILCQGRDAEENNLQTSEYLLRRFNYIAEKLWNEKKSYCYSDVGYILLGWCLEKVKQERLDSLFKVFCNKLNLSKYCNIGFGCDLNKDYAVTTVEYCPIRKKQIKGEVHDENCSFLGGVSGHSGLFASGDSLSLYLNQFLSNIKVENFFQNQNVLLPGWQKGNLTSQGFASKDSTGHLGFTGTSFFYWPQKRAYAILLCNRTHTTRLSQGVNILRKQVYTSLSKQLLL
jgi:serine-type D-Ala-D-Ala carboxypeptidase